MKQIYRAAIAAIFGIFLCCAAGAQQTYTYTYNAAGDRTYKSGIGPEETAGRSAAAALSASGQGTAQARASVPAPRTLSTGSTVAGVDLSCDVGSIPVSSSVTPTGGRTYSIAIPTAAGCRLAPQIALTYNSQGGEGIAGYGWQLSGTSAITVRNRNTYYDDTQREAMYDDTCAAFALDGVPLVPNGQIPGIRYEYSTPTGHALVKKHTNSAGQVLFFSVLRPDGSTATYGFGDNTLPQAVYPLTSVTDADGNVMTFEYIQPDGCQYCLSGVSYGSGCQISLEYEHRADSTYHTYMAGLETHNSMLLKSVISRDGSTVISCDELTHQYTFGSYALTGISRSCGTGRLNDVSFGYGAGTAALDSIARVTGFEGIAPLPSGTPMTLSRGKFTRNDFRDGLMLVRSKDTYAVVETDDLGNRRYGSTYGAGDRVYIFPDPATGDRYDKLTGDNFQSALAMDIDGDGQDDEVMVSLSVDPGSEKTSNDGPMTLVGFDVFSFNGTSMVTKATYGVHLSHVHQEGQFISPNRVSVQYGDFTGSGRVEALIINGSIDGASGGAGESIIVGIADQLTYSCTTFDPYAAGTAILCIDIDGDGQTELCRATETGFGIYRYSTEDSDFVLERSIPSSGMNYELLSGAVTLGDVNGDGYLDILTVDSGSGFIRCHYFTGTTFIHDTVLAEQWSEGDSYQLIDMDRNGLADLVRVRGTEMAIFFNAPDPVYGPFSGSRKTTRAFVAGTLIVPCNAVFYNGMSNILTVEDDSIYAYDYLTDRSALRLMTSMSDSYGVTQTNEYRNIADPVAGDITYGTDPSRTYTTADGYCRMTLPLNVLSRTRTTVPGSTMVTDSTHFMYRDLVVHQRGLGLRGFGSMTQVSSTLGQPEYTVTTFDPENSGVVTHLSRRTGSPTAAPAYEASYNYSRIYRQWSKHTPRLSSSIEEDYLAGICRETSYGYDNLDFATSVTVTLTPTGERSSSRNSDGSYACTQTLTTYDHLIQPSTASPKLLLGRVTQSITARGTDPEGGEMPYMEKTVTTYVSGKARPATVKEYVSWDSQGRRASSSAHSSLADRSAAAQYTLLRETHYGYDSHGNATSQESASYGSTTFVGESCTYDDSGRFVTLKTDVLGNTTTYSGFDAFGNPSSVTDPRGNTTTYTYDTWGRPATVTRPDGSTEQTSYAWCSGSDGRLYKVTVTGNTIPTAVTYYGAADNVLASDQTRFNGSIIRVSRRYYTTGELAGEALPTKSAYIPSSSWSTISYDIHGRRVALTEASGRETTWDYDGLTTTTTEDGVWRTVISGVDGNMLSASDVGGTVTYSYREDGSPVSITAPGNATTTFAYDTYGRRSSMTDPSAGTRTDAWSNLADGATLHTQTSAKGQVRTYANRNGQVTRVERTASAGYTGAFNTDYTYDVYGNLRTVTSSNGTSSSYTYDNLGRQATATEAVNGGRSLTKTFTYDNLGRPASTRYRADTGLDRTETYGYANGYNTSISVGTTTVWQLSSENVFGQPTQATTGTVTRTYAYDTWGLPTGRTMGSVMSFSYAYDHDTGNMLSRTDEKRSITETFTYDNMNRLTGINDSQSGLRSISYANNGNITSITGSGSFSYTASGKPYQLTSAASVSGGIPQYEQTVKYTSYDRPAQIYGPGYDITMTYGADGARMKCVTDTGEEETETRTRYYLGGVYECDVTGGEEKNGVEASITERLYLGGDAYSAPMVLVRNGSGNGTLYNIGRDVQGSITHIASTSGTLVAEYSYDPWGRLRNPATHALYAPGSEPDLMLGRGYTGHEHLKEAGLINMNARLYDPYLGRFLSPDPYVQDAASSQGFNRYSYCLNNPLRYTDESGEWCGVDDLIAALVGGIINLTENIINGNINNGGDVWELIGRGVVAFVSGAVDGWLSVNGLVGLGGAVSAGANEWLSGGDIGECLSAAGRDLILSYVGFTLGKYGEKLGSSIYNHLTFDNSYLKEGLKAAFENGFSSGANEFVSTFFSSGGDWEAAGKAGLMGLGLGLGVGGVGGAVAEWIGPYKLIYAKDQDCNVVFASQTRRDVDVRISELKRNPELAEMNFIRENRYVTRKGVLKAQQITINNNRGNGILNKRNVLAKFAKK